MKTSFKMVAMLLGIGIFPLCAHAQKKVIIEDELDHVCLEEQSRR